MLRVVVDPVGDSAESGEAFAVGSDVLNGVGCCCAGVDFNGGHCGAVDEGFGCRGSAVRRDKNVLSQHARERRASMLFNRLWKTVAVRWRDEIPCPIVAGG